MKKAKRFVVTENGNIIDTLNLLKGASNFRCNGDPEDDNHLRQRVLWDRLSQLVDALIPDPPQSQKNSPSEMNRDIRHSMWWILCTLIRASRLDGIDVAVSVKKRFSGTHKREKNGLLDETSISLFVNDVECLLRDLYGDVEMETVLVAVRTLVEEFTRYSRQDLWEEFIAAEIYDRGVGIGLPEEYGFSAWDPVRGREALSDLIKRSVAVLANQSDYSQYTIKFATYCDEHFNPPSAAVDDDLPYSWQGLAML